MCGILPDESMQRCVSRRSDGDAAHLPRFRDVRLQRPAGIDAVGTDPLLWVGRQRGGSHLRGGIGGRRTTCRDTRLGIVKGCGADEFEYRCGTARGHFMGQGAVSPVSPGAVQDDGVPSGQELLCSPEHIGIDRVDVGGGVIQSGVQGTGGSTDPAAP